VAIRYWEVQGERGQRPLEDGGGASVMERKDEEGGDLRRE